MRIKSLADLPAHIRPAGLANARQPRNKYRNVPTIVDGQRFDSKLEARCYQELVNRVAAGEVSYFLRQVNYVLEGGVKYRCDFLVFLANGGHEVIDAKGALTQSSANKIKQVKDRYGIDVVLWRGK